MNIFGVYGICAHLRELEAGRTTLLCSKPLQSLSKDQDAKDKIAASAAEIVKRSIAETVVLCRQWGLQQALLRVSTTYSRLTSEVAQPDISSLALELENAAHEIARDLHNRVFLAVDLSRSTLLDNKNSLGDNVSLAFPSAVPDIVEAGNCMAAECNTAAVFHLMRATEWALRALASHLGVRRIITSRKPGKKKYIPLAYAEWERILDGLQDAVDIKIRKLKRGSEKQKAQEFYYPILQDIRGVRDAWRNHVMHTRAQYTREDADAVLSHVKRLMGKLAERVSEV